MPEPQNPKGTCIDCIARNDGHYISTRLRRPAPYPGPRCASDHKAVKKTRKAARKDNYQQRTYGITQAEKQLVLDLQDGGCICAPWTDYDGSGKRDLSTDHDHATGEVRGVLCKHCNDLLGRIKDDPTYFRLMIRYLEDPPARKVVGRRIVPGHNPGV